MMQNSMHHQMDVKRRKVRAKRGTENRTKVTIQSRVQQAFENWAQTLLVTKEEDIEKRLTRFLTLRNLLSDVEPAAITFVEQNYGQRILYRIQDSTNKDLQISYLLAASDLVDIDETGVIGRHFVRLGMAEAVISILRSIETRSRYESRLKTAGICTLSSLCLHDMEGMTKLMDEREIQLLNNILQVKSMVHLHSRVITFVNNIYVSGHFQEELSQTTIPSLMTLLMFNVTNHIKATKQNHDTVSESEEEEEEYEEEEDSTLVRNSGSAHGRWNSAADGPPAEENCSAENYSERKSSHEDKRNEPKETRNEGDRRKGEGREMEKKEGVVEHDAEKGGGGEWRDGEGRNVERRTVPRKNTEPEETEGIPSLESENSDEIDPMYDDDLYNEFIESACYLLGNFTTSVDNCRLAEKYSIIDIMTLLFHNTDTTLDALTSVIKCLGNLANIEENRPKLMESNILQIAIKLIKLNIDDEMKAQITLLLANMAGYGNCTQSLVEGGVIDPILDLLDLGNEDYQRFATLALANMAIHISAVPRLMNNQAKVLKTLVELCFVPNHYLQRQACRVLNSIATYPTGLYWNALKEAGAVEALKHIIDSVPEDTYPPSARELAKATLIYIQGTAILLHPLRTIRPTEEAGSTKLEKQAPNPSKALVEKNKGNEYFIAKKYKEAIISYTKALEYDPKNHTLYSNRAAAYMHLDLYELALKDSEKCVELAPDFVKAHFRRGKALLGLEQYSEAVEALTTALKLKKNNREIRDALQHALLQKKDRGNNVVPAQFQKLSAIEVMKELFKSDLYLSSITLDTHQPPPTDSDLNPPPSPAVAHLLTHLFNLLKRCYSTIGLDDYSQAVLLGINDPEKISETVELIGMQLHSWSIEVDLYGLMQGPGIPKLLFETELIASHVKDPSANPEPIEEDSVPTDYHEDLSCHQFGLFVTTILSRLVLQGHSKFGLRALKRLIVLDSNKMVRDSVGSPLTQALLQVSGHGGWGLPVMPALRHLFIHYGGLRCVALDSKDDPTYQQFCVEILHNTSIQEWKVQSTNIIEIVLSNFVLPALTGSDKDLQSKAIDVFARIYSIPEVRTTSFSEWAKQDKEEFSEFCRIMCAKNKMLLKREKTAANGKNPARPLTDLERGEKLAKVWISLPAKERKRPKRFLEKM